MPLRGADGAREGGDLGGDDGVTCQVFSKKGHAGVTQHEDAQAKDIGRHLSIPTLSPLASPAMNMLPALVALSAGEATQWFGTLDYSPYAVNMPLNLTVDTAAKTGKRPSRRSLL